VPPAIIYEEISFWSQPIIAVLSGYNQASKILRHHVTLSGAKGLIIEILRRFAAQNDIFKGEMPWQPP
jgi:hypothetical protein